MAQIKCVFNIHSFISIEFAENHIFRVNVAIRIANKNNIFDANVFDTKISRRIKICIKISSTLSFNRSYPFDPLS